MTPMEIILAIIALTFIVLVIYLAKTLSNVSSSLQKLNLTMDSVQKQIDDLGHEPRNLIHHANAISNDLHETIKRLQPFVRALSNLGKALEYKTLRFREMSRESSWERNGSKNNSKEIFEEAANLAASGISLWQKFQQRR